MSVNSLRSNLEKLIQLSIELGKWEVSQSAIGFDVEIGDGELLSFKISKMKGNVEDLKENIIFNVTRELYNDL